MFHGSRVEATKSSSISLWEDSLFSVNIRESSCYFIRKQVRFLKSHMGGLHVFPHQWQTLLTDHNTLFCLHK